MYKNTNNYSEKKSKRGKYIVIGLVMCVLLVFITAVAAFYSDYVGQTGDVTSGTLKLSGSYTFYCNGVETDLSDIKNLNPGDVIVVKCSVSNTGNKSAWVRDVIGFNADAVLLPYLSVYNGEFTQADFFAQTDLTDYLMTLSDGKAATGGRVIDGSGAYAETESGEDFEYLNAAQYEATFTIYFNTSAGNDTQGKTFSLSVTSQALQFRNNNLAEPSDTAWAAVATA